MKHTPRKLAGGVALATMACLTLAACGSASDSGAESAPVTTSPTAPQGSGAAESTPTAGAADTNAADPNLDPVHIGYISQEKELLTIPEARRAAEAGVAYANAELGGVDGHPLDMQVCQAGDSPESAVACAEQFVNDSSIQLVITSTYNDPAVLKVTSAAGLATITTASTPEDWTVPSAWAFDAGAASLVQGAATFLADNQKVTSGVILCADDPGLLELCDAGAEILGANGITISGVVPISLDEADYTGAVTAAGLDGVDAALLVLDASQCLPVAEALDTIAPDTPILSFDACLRPETLSSGLVDGWFEVVASPLAATASDAGVQEGQRILSTYSSEDPYPYGFAPYGLASAVGAASVLSSIGYDGLSRAAVDSAMSTYAQDFGWYPPISCPGPDPFAGACVRQVTVVQASGDSLADAADIDVDVSAFASMLG